MATLYYYVVCNVFSFGEPTHTGGRNQAGVRHKINVFIQLTDKCPKNTERSTTDSTKIIKITITQNTRELFENNLAGIREQDRV